jgi:hypothetical protein
MPDRKPTAALWLTVALIAVLVGYPLSWGPVSLLQSQAPSGWWDLLIWDFYWPLSRLVGMSNAAADAFQWYHKVWGAPPSYIDDGFGRGIDRA